jgi:putative phosphoesterase
VQVVVLADTHLRTDLRRPDGGRWLPAALHARLEQADAILHAGDVLDQGVLERLQALAPVHAVLGNNDLALVGLLPITLGVEIGGVRIGMIHDSGRSEGRAARLRRRFPDAEVVVFGHSHAPVNELGVDGQLMFNPGSAIQRRAQPVCTFGELELGDGAVLAHRIVPIGPNGPERGSIPPKRGSIPPER